jgi:arsenite methyltransferase
MMSDKASTTCKSQAPSAAISVEHEIRTLYTDLAQHPAKDFGWGKGKENARALGYEATWLEQFPDAVWESAAAVGNPFVLGPIRAGETVVDLGCGAGTDACVAALLVGPSGRVIGIDLTPAMVEKARASAATAGLGNITIQEADMAELPLPDTCAHVVISNGSINLSPRKACVLKHAFRILKPGGRLYIADMVRDPSCHDKPCDALPSKGPTEAWASCVAGTLSPDCFSDSLMKAGFAAVEFVGTTGYRTSPETIGALFRARKPG